MSLELYYSQIYACLQFHRSKALTTWAFFILTLFHFSRFADACTSILFLQSLETCFIPCTSSTIDGAVPSGPFTPFTIDRWRIRFLRRLFFFGWWLLSYKCRYSILKLSLLCDIFTLYLPGHTPLSHGSVLFALPLHGIPPNSSASILILWFDLTPSPLQVTEHSPSFHSPHWQSTGNIVEKVYFTIIL